jgi:hypothetical protein
VPGHHARAAEASKTAEAEERSLAKSKQLGASQFAGAPPILNDNPGMMKSALLAVAGFLALQSSSFAQPLSGSLGGSLWDQPSINAPWALLDSHDRFSFSTGFGSMRATPEYLPALTPSDSLNTAYLSDNKNSVDRIVDLRATDKVRFGGEVGFLYGKSTGSGLGREDYAGYIIGTVGNEHFSLSVGYYHQDTNYSGPRWRR